MKNTKILVAASLAALATATNAAVTVDAFTETGGALTIQNTTAGPATVFIDTAGASILGGSREVSLTKKSGASVVPSDDIVLDVGGGFFGINAANPVTYSFRSIWDGTGEATAVGTLDYGLGLNAFDAEFISFTSMLDIGNSASLTLRFYTTENDYAEFDTGLIAGAAVGFDIPVADFSVVGGGFSWASISAIEMFGDTDIAGTDWNLGDISILTRETPPPVPEVGTAASAAAFALIGALTLLRRRAC